MLPVSTDKYTSIHVGSRVLDRDTTFPEVHIES